ncbi:hypothetical protein L3i22_107400 [Actinoplanes sp. L3-i22]|nr:hypothetical protein L3i22_107400 [Actinoplanes sp. L3-i22]
MVGRYTGACSGAGLKQAHLANDPPACPVLAAASRYAYDRVRPATGHANSAWQATTTAVSAILCPFAGKDSLCAWKDLVADPGFLHVDVPTQDMVDRCNSPA